MTILFRELTEAELDFVAGGNPGDIVVTANRYGGWDYGWPAGWSHNGSGYSTSTGQVPIGGYDDGQPQPPAEFHGLSAVGEALAPFNGQPHMAENTTRPLTQAEKIALTAYTNLTPGQINNIYITSGGNAPGAAATTWSSSTINFDPRYAIKDFSNDRDTMDLLVHEAYHVYQYANVYQNDIGAGYFRMAADEIIANTTSHDYYTYRQSDIQNIIQDPSALSRYNIETQAALAQDYYRISQGLPAQGAVGFTPTAADLASVLHMGN